MKAFWNLKQKFHLKHILEIRPRLAVSKDRYLFPENPSLIHRKPISERFETSSVKPSLNKSSRTNLTKLVLCKKQAFFTTTNNCISFKKRSRNFLEQTFCFSRREIKVKTFWKIVSLYTVKMFEKLTRKILSGIAILRTIMCFLKNTHANLQKAPKMELVENFWAIIPFETLSI